VQLQGSQDASNRAQQTKVLLENSLHIAEAELVALTRPPQPVVGESNTELPVQIAAKPAKPPQRKSEVMQAQLEAMRMRYSDDHPDIRRLRADIAKVKGLEQKEEQDREKETAQAPAAPPVTAKAPKPQPAAFISPEIAREIARVQEQIQNLKTQIGLINQELTSRTAERQNVVKEIANYQKRLEQLPVREQEMSTLMRDYEMTKSNYRSLLDKETSAEMATDMERRQKSERFTVLDPAQPPQKPFKPKRSALYAMGSFLGLALGLAVGFGKEIQKGTLLGEWELPKDVLVLGRIPRMAFLVPESEEPEPGGKHKSRKLRVAVVSSALLSVLGAVAAGIYLILKRP
jgi:hypothetical protein